MSKCSISLVTMACLALLTGCSSITGDGPKQSIAVQTIAADGAEIGGVTCEMTNDAGTWSVVTPGSATVTRSNKNLKVSCKKPEVNEGSADVVSRTKGSMFGNIIFGGGIGAIIDHNNGSAYEYPSLLKIIMGQLNQKIEEKKTKTDAEAEKTKAADASAAAK